MSFNLLIPPFTEFEVDVPYGLSVDITYSEKVFSLLKVYLFIGYIFHPSHGDQKVAEVKGVRVKVRTSTLIQYFRHVLGHSFYSMQKDSPPHVFLISSASLVFIGQTIQSRRLKREENGSLLLSSSQVKLYKPSGGTS